MLNFFRAGCCSKRWATGAIGETARTEIEVISKTDLKVVSGERRFLRNHEVDQTGLRYPLGGRATKPNACSTNKMMPAVSVTKCGKATIGRRKFSKMPKPRS